MDQFTMSCLFFVIPSSFNGLLIIPVFIILSFCEILFAMYKWLSAMLSFGVILSTHLLHSCETETQYTDTGQKTKATHNLIVLD